jgi:hypothetical protein
VGLDVHCLGRQRTLPTKMNTKPSTHLGETRSFFTKQPAIPGEMVMVAVNSVRNLEGNAAGQPHYWLGVFCAFFKTTVY